MDTIRKDIISYIFEIVMLLVLITTTFIGFNNSDLKTYASLAKSYATKVLDAETTYIENTGKDTILLSSKNKLVSGTLYIRNPNKVSINPNIKIKLLKSNTYNIDDIKVNINGHIISKYEEDKNFYIYDASKINLKPYEEKKVVIGIYSTNLNDTIKYYYEIG